MNCTKEWCSSKHDEQQDDEECNEDDSEQLNVECIDWSTSQRTD